MKKIILFLLFVFFFTFSYAQALPAPPPVNRLNDGLIGSNDRYGSKVGKGEISYDEALLEYENIDGSPYLYGGEINVDLITYNDSILRGVDILYDLYNNEIIAKSKTGGIVILDLLYYKGFNFNNDGVSESYLRVNPADFRFNKVLYKNEDFVFCQEIRTKISKDTRYIPGKDFKTQKFTYSKSYQLVQGAQINKSKLRNGALAKYLPWAYRKRIPELKKKLNVKKLNKEKDYLLLMNEF